MKKTSVILIICAFFLSSCSLNQSQVNHKPIASPNTVVSSPTPTPIEMPRNRIISTPEVAGFERFEVKIPADWSLENFDQSNGVQISIEKNGYTITFIQPNYIGGGGTCVFPGDKPLPDGPYIYNFTKFISLKTSFGAIRMGNSRSQGQSPNQDSYSACSLRAKDKYMSIGTPVGAILYDVEVPTDQSIVNEMNKIVESVQLIK